VENFTPFIQSVYRACIDLKAINDDAPLRMLREIKNIGGRKSFEPHYDQLMQKLSEILIMRQVIRMPWPLGTTFEIEAGVRGMRKRIDLIATLPNGQKYGFEVKAPKYTAHAHQRNDKKFQFPPQDRPSFDDSQTKDLVSAIPARDNTLRSFLRSADEKFGVLKNRSEFRGILVIVWDDWIEEAIHPLLNARNGLLTPTTYSEKDGVLEVFHNVDTVLILKHLTNFVEAAADNGQMGSELDPMSISNSDAHPNIVLQLSNAELPEFINTGFNAAPVRHPRRANETSILLNEFA